MFGTHRILLLATLTCLISSVRVIFGQAVSGTINGYVYDTSEAAIAEARVTITNTETGTATNRVTDTTGRYIATNRLPGACRRKDRTWRRHRADHSFRRSADSQDREDRCRPVHSGTTASRSPHPRAKPEQALQHHSRRHS